MQINSYETILLRRFDYIRCHFYSAGTKVQCESFT